MPTREKITAKTDIPGRKRPNLPHILEVAEFWVDRDDWPHYRANTIGFGEPFCARCGWLVPIDDSRFATDKGAWGEASKRSYLERAHLIDRCYDGLDGVQNLVPLCWRCHDVMPSFKPGDEDAALSWVRDYKPTQVESMTTMFLGMVGFEGATRREIDVLERKLAGEVVEMMLGKD